VSPSPHPTAHDASPSPFARLVALADEHERLVRRLRALGTLERETWAYLARPGSNLALAAASLGRIGTRRLEARDRLREIRAEAETLAGRPLAPDADAEAAPEPGPWAASPN
jgi:hypothetical protein